MAEDRGEAPDLLTIAFTVAGERGWRQLSFTEVARRAGMSLAEVYAAFPDRAGLVRALGRRLDSEMLAVDPQDLEGLSPRERVFEMIMRRLDAMAPFREGLRALQRQAAGDLELLSLGFCNVKRLSRWLVDAAESESPLARTRLAARAVGGIYLRVFNVWLNDDTPDLARTLAELDRRLQQAEGLCRWTQGWRRPSPSAAAA